LSVRPARDNAGMPAATATPDPEIARFIGLLAAAPTGFERLVLSAPRPAPEDGAGPEDADLAAADLQRLIVRPLQLRGEPAWSFCFRHTTRDITRNHAPAQGLALVQRWLGARFRHAHLELAGGQAELRIGKRGTGHLRQVAPHAPAEPATPLPAHDRAKQRWVDPQAPWLVALGVMTPQGQLVPAMARKWKQINRFVEIVAGALERLPLPADRPLTLVDFGAGKAYLSFALHGWLRTRGLQPHMLGVEQRAELVAAGRRVAAELGLPGFEMVQGDVGDAAAVPPNFDVMIALHACDTATDAAIHRGIVAGAQLIVCSPCCHRQLRPQLLSPQPLKSVFEHGIHAEQQAEMLTDTLRALLLQAEGYETQVFEFVALEHTRKNKMILAVRRPEGTTPARRAAALAEVDELQRFFGFREQALLALLQAQAAASSPRAK
jgi:hypothetical protein